GDRHYDADLALMPLLHGQQVDREIRPKPAMHIGQEEIDRIQRQPAAPHIPACSGAGVGVSGQRIGRKWHSVVTAQPVREFPGRAYAAFSLGEVKLPYDRTAPSTIADMPERMWPAATSR